MIIHDPSPEKFDELILKGGKLLVDFWAGWCGPCRMQAPIVEELSAAEGIDLVKIDVDKCEELSERYGVQAIPTLLLYDGGKPLGKFVGLTSADDIKKAFGL